MNFSDLTNQTIFQQSPISTQVFSPNGESLMANKAWEKLWGVRHSQIQGYNILKDKQLVDKSVMPFIKRGFKGEVVSVPAVRYEPNVTKKVKGAVEYKWVRALIYPVKNRSNKIVQIVLQHTDITHQQGVEDALRQSEERLRLAVDAGKVGVWDWDILNNKIIWSDRIYKIHGVKKSEFKGTVEEFTRLIHPDDLDRVSTIMQNSLNSKAPYEVEFRAKGPRGRTIWIYTSAKVVFENEKAVRMLGATIDVTERKELERQKDESLALQELLFENAPVGIFRTDVDGNCLYVNKRWSEYSGMSYKQAMGQGWVGALHPQDKERVFIEWYQAASDKKEFISEYRFMTPKGKVTWLHGNANSIKDKDNKIIGFLGTIVDVTERRRLERQKDDFLGIASHELKTPVTSLKAFGQVLQRRLIKSHDTESSILATKMDTQINRLTSLINDLLDVTKIEGGKLQFRVEKFKFDDLVDEVVEQIQQTTEFHKISVKGKTESIVSADRDRVGQVMMNFLTNALKYSPNSKRVIVKRKKENGSVCFSVQDFGLGIPKENIPNLFQRFFRVNTKVHNRLPGIGLGLYISKEIVTRQGGRMWVESKEGQGSIFYFTIPIK